MIMLSKCEVRSLSVSTSFSLSWVSGQIANMIIFPSTIPGLHVHGDEIPSLSSYFKESALGIKFSKLTSAYPSFISTNNMEKCAVSNGEHNTFLLFWLCKYFVSTSSIAIVNEFSYYLLGHYFWMPLSFSTAIPVSTVQGPLYIHRSAQKA